MPSNVEALRRRPNAVLHRNGKETPRTDDESSSSWSIESEAPSHAAQSKQRTPSVSGDSTARAALEHQSPFVSESKIAQHFLRWIGLAVWPVMLFLPLLLNHTSNCHYSNLFPRAWYTIHGESWLDKSIEEGGIWEWGTNIMCGSSDKPLRHPLGLSLGISAVAIGHVFLLVYFRLHQQQLLGKTTPVQRRGAVEYVYFAALKSHLSQPGGFLLLGLYLTITWVFDMLPPRTTPSGGGYSTPASFSASFVRISRSMSCTEWNTWLIRKCTKYRTSRITDLPIRSCSTRSMGASPTRRS